MAARHNEKQVAASPDQRPLEIVARREVPAFMRDCRRQLFRAQVSKNTLGDEETRFERPHDGNNWKRMRNAKSWRLDFGEFDSRCRVEPFVSKRARRQP